MDVQSHRQALTQARRLFDQQGVVPGGLVAEPILRSWRRCADLGFEMRGARRAEPLTAGELREARQRNETLRCLSEPALSWLRREGGGNGLVILSDARGLVLDSEGNADFAQRAARVALMPGARWDETAAGTNAIGTALVEGRAFVVDGAEHYFEPNRILTCAAAPIRDSAGRLLGVLDLSSAARAARPGVLARVRAAADSIEQSLFDAAHASCAVLCLYASRYGSGQPGEAARLAFQGDLLVGANRRAMQALGLAATALGVYRYADLFDGGLEHLAAAAGRVHARSGACYHARLCGPRTPTAPQPLRRLPAAAAWPTPAARGAIAHFDAATLSALARAVHLSDAGMAILLQGETGVGKEIFARQLHARGQRAAGPFVAVNCAALPESLIESELFGYEAGAFTGARRQGSKGLLRQAHGGVLFLDEIGDMPLALQARLLRVLQSREVSPLGAARPVAVDFALVCATHRALAPDGTDAPVRPDLYFRIAEYTVTLAPLRQRADLRELLRALWATQGAAPVLPADIEDTLAHYAWPGNYRQLVAVLRTLHVLAGVSGVIECEMLPAQVRRAAAMPPPPAVALRVQTLTDEAIRAALAAHAGNVSAAARVLGLHRSTLYRRARGLLRSR